MHQIKIIQLMKIDYAILMHLYLYAHQFLITHIMFNFVLKL